jgi:hypothetical protein
MMKKSQFERIVDRSFWELETKHGLRKTETIFRPRGCNVHFQNTTTEVVLNFEIGGVPWLTIADIKNPETDKSSLDWLLVELGQKKPPTPDEAFVTTKLDESQLETTFQKQSAQLLEFGASILNGDFAILPQLQQREVKYLADCKKFVEKHKIKS